MEKENCFYLGKLTRVVGFKGEIVAFIDSDEPEKYHELDAVFVDINDNLIPFFVESISPRNRNNQLTLKFQDIDDHEEAARLQGRDLYLPASALPPLEGDAFYFHEVTGFEVHDAQKGFIGNVLQVLDYPGNPLFEIKFENKTLLIPIQEHIISRLDRENRRIFIDAPTGLIDLYMNE
ncbi:MAG: ribosome maturation factor RimM [Bacteroidota bacterium]